MRAFDMGDVAVLEAADHVGDRVAFADGGEELVAEPLALRGAADEAGDVDEGEPGRDDLLRAGDLGQHVETGIGHRDLADVGLDGAERIVGRLRRRGLRQRVEERRLADIGQADDAAFETHEGEDPSRERAPSCAGAAKKARAGQPPGATAGPWERRAAGGDETGEVARLGRLPDVRFGRPLRPLRRHAANCIMGRTLATSIMLTSRSPSAMSPLMNSRVETVSASGTS